MNCYTCEFCIQHYNPDMGSNYYYYECAIDGTEMKADYIKTFRGSMAEKPDRKCDVTTIELQDIIDKMQEEINERNNV